jgi:hypothetical protein
MKESIRLGLEAAGNELGNAGVVSLVRVMALQDYRLAAALIGMITPRAVEASITTTEFRFQAVAELDADLQKAGLPPSRELFLPDWRGTTAPEDDEVQPEVIKDK